VGERDLTLQSMGGIGLMSGVLGALPGLGLLLLSVRGALHMGGACESVIYNNLYYLVSVCCFLPVNLCILVYCFLLLTDFRSGDDGYALFHGFFSCVVIIRLSSGWLPMILTAVVHVTHLTL